MGELLNRGLIRGFITASTDEGRPEPAEAPAIEAIYTEVLARSWSAEAGSASRPTPETAIATAALGPAGRPGRRRGRMHRTRRLTTMQVSVTIHQAWLARPDDLRRLMALLAGLEIPPPPMAAGEARPVPAAHHPSPATHEEEDSCPEGHAPARTPSRPDRGDALGAPGRRAGPRRADRREAVPRLGVEAGPGHERPADRLREEEGAALEDRRMDAAAGRGGVPVRPRPAAIYDPLTEPCPPTPRADAFARIGLGMVPAKAPQPVDCRATADLRPDLARGGDRGTSQG